MNKVIIWLFFFNLSNIFKIVRLAKFWFSDKSAKLAVIGINGEVAFVDPLAENWSANLREVANKFKSALK